MMIKSFDGYSWSLGFWGFICVFYSFFLASGLLGVTWGSCSLLGVDSVSFYLGTLSIFLLWALRGCWSVLSSVSKMFIGLSVFFSVLSYSIFNSFWFWVSYEMSILPLLCLIVLESPYSERYLASWYLLGYIVLTGLPMLLCVLYLSFFFGSFALEAWSQQISSSLEVVPVLLVLGVLFITKVPLPPFHVWLPIVHAEASSVVSVCLSGYIMKLGLLGVCRFCMSLVPSYIFSKGYVIICLCLCVMFFCAAACELDGKRWLAFLSLAHIIIAWLCLSITGWDLSGLSFYYSLGHGLSAGLIFLLLWVCYEVSGSRNWGVLKFSLTGSLFFRCFCASCLVTAASLPPTLQFFSEVLVLGDCGLLSGLVVLLVGFYLFWGGLVPLFLVGSLLSRHYSVSFGSESVWVYISGCSFLLLWCFILFFVA